ncbi:hypothetical protein RUE5091_00264 [Ruegeria denitrificans]|uniref:Uncharacterized protein n=1 Tax=Ruegeria denitrificans TaxID=1715692 RepID=A0A0P1I1N9_9RHOB|nr:hypothetical protein RUE5091_00264 [Ruegeria denitrificans]
MSPWLFGFSGNVVAAWYTGLIGLGVLVTTLFALVNCTGEVSNRVEYLVSLLPRGGKPPLTPLDHSGTHGSN